jgi:hypothetical protein
MESIDDDNAPLGNVRTTLPGYIGLLLSLAQTLLASRLLDKEYACLKSNADQRLTDD